MSRNTGDSRPGLTIKGDYGYRYCDVTIPGFVIRVDKMEEPQWGHKFPEKEEMAGKPSSGQLKSPSTR